MASARFLRLRRLLAVAFVATLIGVLGFALVAHAHGIATTAIPLKDAGYKYQQVAPGDGVGFEAVAFDDSSWATGAAGFGSQSNGCSWNNPTDSQTPWSVGTDMLVRKHFTLPAGAHNLKIVGSVDNDATVYLNGTQVGNVVLSGFCAANAINLTASDALLNAGDNVLAIRGHDYGGVTYLDVQVTFDGPAYGIGALYDSTKAHKAGSTVPLKLQLLDGTGANVSAESIVIHATALTKLDNTASSAIDDSGSANSPELDFRYDAALGGYIFNLSTKGLTAGTWALSFTVNGESYSNYVLAFDVR